ELLETREGERHSLERQCERDDAAAVDTCAELVRVELGRLGVDGVHLALDAMAFEPVALAPPAARPAECEHPRVLAAAVVVQPARGRSGRPAFELALLCRRLRQERPDCSELIRIREV